ncbi:MAG TPA: methionine adenosyltransferase domain-containing protein [Acidobacteriota bacterium]|nr:methionine adenosyltransferase domain-containing protein [Acidobacteriota bacterium]
MVNLKSVLLPLVISPLLTAARIPPKCIAAEPISAAIIARFNLLRPIYRQTTNYGHFGKPGLPWEA